MLKDVERELTIAELKHLIRELERLIKVLEQKRWQEETSSAI